MTQQDIMYASYKPTTLDYTKLLSVVYAVTLLSFGLIFPIAEALKDQWLETVYHTVFLTFTLTLSSIFLVYLLFFVLRGEKASKNKTILKKKLTKLKDFSSIWKSKVKKKVPTINVELTEPTEKDLMEIPQPQHPEEHKHRYTRRKSNISFGSFSGIEFGLRRTQPKSTDNLSIASFHKSSKLLHLRGVEPVQDMLPITSKRHKHSNFSLSINQPNDKETPRWTHENDEDPKTESEEEEEEVLESQTWINTDSFGNAFTHHGSNLFLRLGALIFGLGNLVNYALEIQASLITNVECSHKMRFGWIFIWMFIFVFLQTYFLFKHAKINVTRQQPLVWFGMVHLIITNINLWVHTMIQEIIDEHHYKTLSKLHSQNPTSFNEALKEKCDSDLLNEASKYLTPFVFEYSLVAVGSISCFIYFGAIEADSNISKKSKNITKVFSVTPSDFEQYVQQINMEEARASRSESKVTFSDVEKGHKQISHSPNKLTKVEENNYPSKHPSRLHKPQSAPVTIPVDLLKQQEGHFEEDSLQKSHMGLFAGMVILCITIVTSVVFLFSQLQHNRSRAEIIYFSTDIVVHLLLLIACVAAFILTKNLALAPKPVTTDDILILLAAFGSITYEVINASALFTTLRLPFEASLPSSNATMPLHPATNHSTLLSSNTTSMTVLPSTDESYELNDMDPFHLIRDQLQLVSALLGMVQTAVQTLLIFISLRRYPATIHEATEMPGRGTLAFLIVGNLSVWIFRTILCKNLQLPAQIEFYGEMGCLLLTNIHLPMLLFFRFHSSVCLVDIWKSAYQLLTQEIATA